jgi:hypothetical protein
MKNYVRKIAVPAVMTLAFATASAWAQTPASGAAAPATKAALHAQKRQDAVEQRIAQLHQEMKITDQQSQQWDAFAQAVRDNAKSTSDAFRERAGKLATMSADDAMKSYASIDELRAQNTQKLSNAFSTLYASLSDEQKKTTDVLFRNQHEHAHAERHRKSMQHQAPTASKAAAPEAASS